MGSRGRAVRDLQSPCKIAQFTGIYLKRQTHYNKNWLLQSALWKKNNSTYVAIFNLLVGDSGLVGRLGLMGESELRVSNLWYPSLSVEDKGSPSLTDDLHAGIRFFISAFQGSKCSCKILPCPPLPLTNALKPNLYSLISFSLPFRYRIKVDDAYFCLLDARSIAVWALLFWLDASS